MRFTYRLQVGHSAAMIADAAHSLTDLISDVVTVW